MAEIVPVPTPYGEHLLPPNATALQIALSGSDHRMLAAPTWVIRAAWDPDTCPVHLLPYLAQAWSVDEWDPAWSEVQKRQAIKDSVWIHQHKGTIGALKRAIAQLGLPARVSRWFEHGGAPYTFRLFVTIDAVTAWTSVQAARLFRVAINNKAVRSYLDRITVQVTAQPAPVYVGVVTHTRLTLGSYIGPVTEITGLNAYAYVGVATHSRIAIDTVIT